MHWGGKGLRSSIKHNALQFIQGLGGEGTFVCNQMFLKNFNYRKKGWKRVG
jgi:hypothetical protein